ncbi:hypothetical protein PVK06_040637 [Gossypium arboreum]|uniref:Aminotransferase-like plant mobile domain-containing protein n=1 Tax=Gossypium arboreum TaxID=29729 RepID=A0ABR0N6U4_GOSAR|nr:hypothetical protein PVK06_040637 [Gossypium arboreum]
MGPGQDVIFLMMFYFMRLMNLLVVVLADGRVLEGTIYNLAMPSVTELRGYLQEVEFLHTSCMLYGCKLGPTLISTLVERWSPKTHTFHLSCCECIITLENIVLQLSLSVDRPAVTRSIIIPGEEDLCATLLGKVSNSFEDGWVWMKWLETNFKKLPSHAIDIVREK